MKNRFRLVRRGDRGSTFYAFDTVAKQWGSLKTQDRDEALRLVAAKNEASNQPAMSLQLARVYIQHGDPTLASRTWQHVMVEQAKCKQGSTKERWVRGVAEEPFDLIRDLKLIETKAEHFITTLSTGTVSTNIFLRRLHNFALDMSWLLAPIIPRRQWPKIEFKDKRGVTFDEYQKILASERNPEWKAYYQLLWHLGGSQSDIASLVAEDINWQENTVCYRRMKTKTPVVIHFGEALSEILKGLPSKGPLFPMLINWPETDRAKGFIRRCRLAKVNGVSLHSFRYSWSERAKAAGMPERFAMENLGHNSKAVHRAYWKKALVKIPSLEEYEAKIVPMPQAAVKRM